MKTNPMQGWKRKLLRLAFRCSLISMAVVGTNVLAADNPLVLGIFPRNKPADTTTMYTPLANHLSEQLGRKVQLVTSKNFETFWSEVKARRFDIVHFNQYHYVNSSQIYRVVAYNQEFGRSKVAGAIYVRKDSGITSLSQLRGRTVMFGGGKDAMLSYIAPRFLLMQAGLKESDFTTKFAVSPPNAVLAMYHHQADAAGGGDILLNVRAVRNAINADEVTLLGKTEALLFLPWAVKRNMDAKLGESIQSILLGLGESDAGKAILKSARTTGLGKAEDKDYDPHRKMTAAVFGPNGTSQ